MKIENKIVEHMQLEIDGALTPAQREELKRQLSESGEARAAFDELSRLARSLDSHPAEEPPPSLHARIMGAIDKAAPASGARMSAPRPRNEHGFGAWFSGGWSGSRLRVATTFGLGLATGAFLLAAIRQERPDAWNFARAVDPSNVSGTMMAPPSEREPLGSVPVDVADGGITGSLEANRFGGETRFDVSIAAADPVDWMLSFDPATWEVARIERPSGVIGSFALTPSAVHGSATGPGHVTIVMKQRTKNDQPGQPVLFQIVQSGRVVFERSAPPVSP